MSQLLPVVDWELVADLGRRLTAAEHHDVEELNAAAAGLRLAAGNAVDLVAEASQLNVRPEPRVLAIDRATWMAANAQLAKTVFERVEAPPQLNLRRKVTRRLNALLVAGGMGVMGRGLIGQFDPFSPGGRLLLVVPNVLRIEKAFQSDPYDFRLWTALHEQVHATQFAAAPWLCDHLIVLIRRVASDKGMQWVGKLSPRADADASEALDQIMAMMTFLEGHAEVMTDIAANGVIGTLAQLRRSFDGCNDTRRPKLLDLMGIMSKAEQYTVGASFCRQVIAEGGVTALNRAFDGADRLPSLPELANPGAWLERNRG